MQERQVDVAVIGAGTAGLSARREAARNGASVVMIESGPYGTTCARVGCMPSKLLLAAAEVAHEIRHAKEFGIEVAGEMRVDGPAVLERVRRHRDRFVGFVVSSVEDLPPEQRLRGRARFVAPTVLEVDDHTRVTAKAVVIATGTRPIVPSSLASLREHVLTSDEVFELSDLPGSLAVIGTGAIGMEIGQAMHRLGVRTSLFSHGPRIGPISDPEVERVVREVLRRELDVHLDVSVDVSRTEAGKFVFRWTSNGRSEQREFDRVLAAAGREPNLDGLGLENTGLALDSRGIPFADERTMQCGTSPIFLAGDVDAERPVLHEAADEGSIAGSNAALFPDVRAHVRRTPLSIVFSDPQMAVVGRPYSLIDKAHVEIGAVDYSDQGRAVVMAKNAGLVRIYAERETARIIGAEMFGPRVEHTAHLLAWAIERDLDVDTALHMPFYHPVVEEGIRTAIRDLCARLKLAAEPRPKDLECGPGV